MAIYSARYDWGEEFWGIKCALMPLIVVADVRERRFLVLFVVLLLSACASALKTPPKAWH